MTDFKTYPVDKALRTRYFVPESKLHVAKANLYLVSEILGKYTQPGDTVLDPMGGSGSILIAALLGRNVIAFDLEQLYVDQMRRSWNERMIYWHGLQGQPHGKVVIDRADARHLDEVPVLESVSIDHVIFSPPYEHAINHNGAGPLVTASPGAGERGGGYGKVQERGAQRDRTNIGDLRGEKYWKDIRAVYSCCYKVTKDSGSLVLIVGNYVRRKKLVDFVSMTSELVENVGYKLLEKWSWRKQAVSIWRRNLARETGILVEDEWVLVFRK